MHIVHIASECAPFAKVGGLADVVQGLSSALIKKGQKVSVYLPEYGFLQKEDLPDYIELISADMGEAIYGTQDDTARFLRFCKNVIDTLLQMPAPDVIHLHDWLTAGCFLFTKHPHFENTRFVLTIHSLTFQGHVSKALLQEFGIERESDTNLIAEAIEKADHVTTVSKTFAEEVKTAEFGCGLEALFRQYSEKFTGIVNGIDYDYWIAPEDKKSSKKKLQERLGLAVSNKPLAIVISRLVYQKGIDAILEAYRQVDTLGCQLVILGSCPDPKIEAEIKAEEKSQSENKKIIKGHDEALAKELFSAADFVLVPSLFEPCGLTQLIGLRYGAVPIVRKTGGLADTVFDMENGFVFLSKEPQAFVETMQRAITLYRNEPAIFEELRCRAMQCDCSWEKASDDYLEIYSGKKVELSV